MAVRTYRFRRTDPDADAVHLTKEAGATVAVVGDPGGATVVDLDIEETAAEDLKESMVHRGWTFVAVDQVTARDLDFAQSVDGDAVALDYAATNYTPDDLPAEAPNTGALAAHLKGLDTAIGDIPDDHAALRQLIHFVEGPGAGWASGAFEEITPSGSPFPTNSTWYESAAKLKKIVDQTVVYNANKTFSTETWRMFDTDGSTVLVTLVDTYTYDAGGVFIDSVTRTWS